MPPSSCPNDRVLLFLTALLAALPLPVMPAPPADGTSAAAAVMRQVESNQEVQAESVSFEMVLVDRSGLARRRMVREFRQRDARRLESILIFFDDPPDIRGSALLSRERVDGFDDQWLFLPAVGKIRRIAESGRSDYFLGTDLTFEDLSVEDVDRFRYEFAAPDESLGGRLSRVIDAYPADSAAARRSGYSRRRIWVDGERFVILKTDFYDREGVRVKTLKTSSFAAYPARSEKIWRANQIEVDNVHRRHHTIIRSTGRSLFDDFPPDLFTPRTLLRGVPGEMRPHPIQTSLDTP